MKFTVKSIDNDAKIFCIVKKDALYESGGIKKLPIEVYGFLREEGRSYENSCVERQNISDEVLSEITELAELVRLIVWQKD